MKKESWHASLFNKEAKNSDLVWVLQNAHCKTEKLSFSHRFIAILSEFKASINPG